MKNKLTVQKAADLMNVNAQYIRLAIQKGRLPFGHSIKISSQYSYYISIHKFSDYTGIPISEIEAYCGIIKS